jgi:NADPH2:quinone reductase
MIVRLGRAFGFKTVNIVRRADAAEELRGLGADACVVHDTTIHPDEDFRSKVREATGEEPLSAAIDCIGGETGSRALRILGDQSRLVVYGTMSNEPLTVPSRTLMSGDRTLSGFWLGPWMARQSLLSKIGIVRSLGKLHREGVFTTAMGTAFPVEQFRDALRAEPRAGKILLRFRS